jgi:hypothetical protein
VPEELAKEHGVNIHEWFDVLVKAAKATVLQAPANGFAKVRWMLALPLCC